MAVQNMDARYKLAPGVQVREEDFGLLFYNQDDPRLLFVSSGNLLGEDFFLGRQTVEESVPRPRDEARVAQLVKILATLKDKGVILEC